MADTITLNNEIHHVEENNLPCLIHYAPKSGGSHFSVAMVADLFLSGSKILFFTAYPMAKDNFLKQINAEETKTDYITNINQLNTDTQAIILESGNEKLFIETIKNLDDIEDRVVLIKNMEVFSDTALDLCLNLPKIILSGDLDQCSAKKQISDKEYKTIILFNKTETPLSVQPPKLEKYKAYLWSENKKGIVDIQIKNQ